MLIMLPESRYRRCKLLRHPANAGLKHFSGARRNSPYAAAARATGRVLSGGSIAAPPEETKRGHMGAPKVERGALFVRVGISIVDARYAADDAGFVIENRLDHMRLNAKPGHAAGGRAAEIVQRPRQRLSNGTVTRAMQRRVEQALHSRKADGFE
jgi:hypothetical protein